MKPTFRPPILLLSTALAACSIDTEPLNVRPPKGEPVPVTFRFACGNWTPFQPEPTLLVLADLELAGRRDDVEAAVVESGGSIIHRFNVPVLRVAIRAGLIPALRGIASAEGVPDPASLDVEVLVIYSRAVAAPDLQRMEQAGARDIQTFQNIPNFVKARIPDAQIPAVRTFPGVSSVGVDATLCGF